MKTMVNPSECPTGQCYILQVFRVINVEDGYGSSYPQQVIDQAFFSDKEKWKNEIISLYKKDLNRKDILAFEAKQATVDRTVSININ